MRFELLSARIAERLKALAMSEREACLRAEINVDSVRRIRNDFAPKPETLAKLAGALRVPPSYFLEAAALAESKGVPLSSIFVRGAVQAGVWRDAIEWSGDEWYSLTVPTDDRYPGIERFGLLVKGDSMDRLYPDGTVVVCVRFLDIARQPKPGERVICERRSSKTGDFEATVKEYQRDDDGRHVLWPRSSKPEFQQPFILGSKKLPIGSFDLNTTTARAGHLSDDDEVLISGLVTQSVRRE